VKHDRFAFHRSIVSLLAIASLIGQVAQHAPHRPQAETSPTEMTAKVTTRVGPIKATFTGNVVLSDIDAPKGYTITGEGKGGSAGYAKGGARVRLTPDGNATLLSYDVQAEVGGKLAQLGGRLIDSTAKKLAGEFFATFGRIVGGETADEAPGAEAASDAVARAAVINSARAERAARSSGAGPWLLAGAAIVAIALIYYAFAH
jgi:uncharacterized protein